MSTFRVIEKINKGDLCCGCGLCRSLAGDDFIEILIDESGYLRPRLKKELDSHTADLIARVCPGLTVSHENQTPLYDPLWGTIRSLQVGYAPRPEIRFRASSGGAITAILIYLLESKYIDSVLHVGASETDPIANVTCISKTGDDIVANCGSRYAPSAPLTNLREYLQLPGRLAIVGKPCDISALRLYSRHEPLVDMKIKCMISFFCAGVPSRKGSIEILKTMGISIKQLRRFTYRGNGWPGRTRAELDDGTPREMTYEQSWGNILNRYLQTRCKICPDGGGEFADITCGDAWNVNNGRPDFEEHEGRSLIIARTDVGENLVTESVKKGALIATEYDRNDLTLIQPFHAMRKRLVRSRLFAMKLLFLPVPRYSGLALANIKPPAGIILNTRSFLGMFRRALQLRNGKKRNL
jgi:coenzyme F420 hydrogenase subunit beta